MWCHPGFPAMLAKLMSEEGGAARQRIPIPLRIPLPRGLGKFAVLYLGGTALIRACKSGWRPMVDIVALVRAAIRRLHGVASSSPVLVADEIWHAASIAAQYGYIAVVQAVLEECRCLGGAYANDLRLEYAALNAAATFGQDVIVRLLLEATPSENAPRYDFVFLSFQMWGRRLIALSFKCCPPSPPVAPSFLRRTSPSLKSFLGYSLLDCQNVKKVLGMGLWHPSSSKLESPPEDLACEEWLVILG